MYRVAACLSSLSLSSLPWPWQTPGVAACSSTGHSSEDLRLAACWLRDLRAAPGSATCAPMMRPAAVPLLVLCQVVSQLCAGRAEDVVTVTDASWASTIESEAAEWMVEFYAPWVRTAALSSIPYCSGTPPDVRVRANRACCVCSAVTAKHSRRYGRRWQPS